MDSYLFYGLAISLLVCFILKKLYHNYYKNKLGGNNE